MRLYSRQTSRCLTICKSQRARPHTCTTSISAHFLFFSGAPVFHFLISPSDRLKNQSLASLAERQLARARGGRAATPTCCSPVSVRESFRGSGEWFIAKVHTSSYERARQSAEALKRSFGILATGGGGGVTAPGSDLVLV